MMNTRFNNNSNMDESYGGNSLTIYWEKVMRWWMEELKNVRMNKLIMIFLFWILIFISYWFYLMNWINESKNLIKSLFDLLWF